MQLSSLPLLRLLGLLGLPLARASNAVGESFLAANSLEPGVITTASGLQYKIIAKGDGTEHPLADTTCRCYYEGRIAQEFVKSPQGAPFDSSMTTPTSFSPSGVITGWKEALMLMVPGDKWELYIPSELAYGERGFPGAIGPGDALVFTLQLAEISTHRQTVAAAVAPAATNPQKLVATVRAASRNRAYTASRSRCRHGEDGMLINVHHESSPRAYRQSLQARLPADVVAHPLNRFRKEADAEWEHVRAVHVHSLHPEMLSAVMEHEHTLDVEASCVYPRALPHVHKPSEKKIAGLFQGRYRDSSYANCQNYIDVRERSEFRSAASVTIRTPAGVAPDCDGVHDVVEHHSAIISMDSTLLGGIELVIPPSEQGGNASILAAEYASDANGHMSDKILWAKQLPNGSVTELEWVKMLGPEYEKNSSIGPTTANGAKTRNPKAWQRWNWGLDRIDTPGPAVNNEYTFGAATGNGTTLYNLDTGIFVDHDDFGGRAFGGYSVGCPTGREQECMDQWTYRGIIDDEVLARDPETMQGCSEHGTHTASTAAGTKYGVAHGASVVAVQVLDCQGSGSDAGIMDGMEWTLKHWLAQNPKRPAVASLSLGGENRATAFDAAVKRFAELGMPITVAAGNDDKDACGGSPADVAEAITVGASMLVQPVVANGKLITGTVPPIYDQVASFSDGGSCIDIFAPGDEILAAVPSFGSKHMTAVLSGTSMATPIVAGVVLQILGMYPTFMPNDVLRAMYCLSTKGALIDADPHTKNYLVQGGAQLSSPSNRQLIQSQQEFTDPTKYEVGRAPSLDATQCFLPGRDEGRGAEADFRALVPKAM